MIIIELLSELTATKVLQERALADPKIDILCNTRIEAIKGSDSVKSLQVIDVPTQQRSEIEVNGILIHVGLEPNTGYLRGMVPLDEEGRIVVNEFMEPEIAGVFAAGDVRHNSPMQIVTATADGAIAGLAAARYIREMKPRV